MKRFAVLAFVGWIAALLLTAAIAQRGPRGGPGGRGRVAFIRGTIAAVDAGKRVVDITPMGREDQVISVTIAEDALVAAITDAKVSELAVGDNVEVSGFPAALVAQDLRIGGGLQTIIRSAFLPPDAPQGAFRPGGRPMVISGTVAKLKPLTLDIGNGVMIQVAASDNTPTTKVALVELDDLKPTEPVLAVGQRDQQGNVTVRAFAVDRTEQRRALGGGFGGMRGGPPMGMRGPGGPGGRPGGGPQGRGMGPRGERGEARERPAPQGGR